LNINGDELAGKVANKRTNPCYECHDWRQALKKTWLFDIVRNGLREALRTASPTRKEENRSEW
jgi:hypothetical protein